MTAARFSAAVLVCMLSGPPALAENYRLIHALGNDEMTVARDISKEDCERLKADRKAVAEALGTHSERLGVGSITCLPEVLFAD